MRSMVPNLIPMAVLLPLLGAALTLAYRRSAALQRTISVGVLATVVAVAAVLIQQTDAHGPQVLWLGAWPEPLGIPSSPTGSGSLMLLVSAVVALLVLIFAIGQGQADDEGDTPMSIFHPTYLVLMAGVSNAFLAGDLFNLFVGFEILLFASYVLLTLGGTGPRIHAGTTYVVVSLVSSSLFLIAIASAYAATGTVNLAQLALRIEGLPASVALVVQLALLTTFGIKAAVFPMSSWLPDSLSDRDRAGDGRLRRPAHQGRRLRDHPDPDAPLPRVPPHRPAHVGRAADHDRRHPRCGVPDGTQAHAVLHPGEPHRLHDLRRRPRE